MKLFTFLSLVAREEKLANLLKLWCEQFRPSLRSVIVLVSVILKGRFSCALSSEEAPEAPTGLRNRTALEEE